MIVSVGHMLRSHFRAASVIALGAAVLTFGAVMVWRVDVDRHAEEERRVVDQEMRVRQHDLEERVAEVEAKSLQDRALLDELAFSITARDAADEAVPPSSPLRAVVGSIVELVCIDNANKEVYYTASGTVVDPSGLILTNRHILLSEDGSLIEFCGVGFTEELRDSPTILYVAAARAAHTDTDLALLEITERLDGKPLPDEFSSILVRDNAVPAKELELGDSIFIGGYPGIGADTFTFTQGVVSGLVGTNLVKTSALIDSGTSGGAAFDANGRFIGVPTAAVRGEIGGSLGYLISSDAVDDFLAAYFAGANRLQDPQ